MWRPFVILWVAALAGALAACPKDNPEDDYQMPPLPEYQPGGPSRPPSAETALPKYQQWEPVVAVVPQQAPASLSQPLDGGSAAVRPSAGKAK